MRIRKRFLSLSAAITSPPSLDLPGGNHNHRQIGLQPSTWASSGNCSHPNKSKIFKELESERKKELINSDDTVCRKESILCAEANNHDLVLKGWLEGDRLVPTKKKRGSHGRRLNNDVVQDIEMPKKNDKRVAVSLKNTKIEKREGVIMEGSRCSRVNGRGWRCSQQTLVGYSLCEHHLGKGRLRSMTNVRGRAHAVAPKEQHTKERNDDDDDDDDDWDVESVSSMEGTKVFSKKTKMGMVKARSLSSLLSQISS